MCVHLSACFSVSLTSDALFKNFQSFSLAVLHGFKTVVRNTNQVLAGQCTDTYMCVRSLGDFFIIDAWHIYKGNISDSILTGISMEFAGGFCPIYTLCMSKPNKKVSSND